MHRDHGESILVLHDIDDVLGFCSDTLAAVSAFRVDEQELAVAVPVLAWLCTDFVPRRTGASH